jgi:alkylated DNA nucleotide flippase Atl1
MKATFEMSIETRTIRDLFKDAEVGEIVTYADLATALGREVNGANPNVQSAINSLIGEGILLENVRGIGYKRLADTEVVGTAEHARKGMKRKASKQVKKLACVQDFDAMPNEAKVKHNAAVSIFGAIGAMLGINRYKRVEAAVEKTAAQLPLAKTLEAFKG